MTRMHFLSALLTAAGAAGTVSLLFSYWSSDTFLFGTLSFLLVMAGSLVLSALPEKRRFPLLALIFFCLLAGLLLFKSAMQDSFTALSIPFLTTLKEPYDVDLVLPRPVPGASPIAAEIFLLALLSWFFLCGLLSKAGAVLISLLSFVFLLLGFYFGINPPPLAFALSGAYMISLPARLKGGETGHPEIPAFLSALVIGILLSLLVPESRYEQPALFSRMQEEIVSLVDPYDPVFHAGNAYTGMMKGTDGSQKLGNVNGIRYSGRIIADIESSNVSHRLYLRSWSGGDYRNNQWKDLPDSSYDSVRELFEKNQGEWYDQGAWLMEVIARSPALSQSLSNYMDNDKTVEGLKKEFSVDAVYEKTRFFLLPYDTSFGAPLFAFDRSPVSREGKAYSTYLWDLPAGSLLSMMAGESISDPYYRTYLGAEKEYRRFVYSHYLEIPDSVKEGLAALGPVSPVRTLSEKRQRVDEIRRFLAENYTYTTNPGKTPEGKDFITFFLTENRKGYCTAFASSAVMLLRASGIPARYAAGLTVGPEEINGAPVSEDGLHQYSVNDHHAHAWAEVYVDGLGWRPVEMTPGYDGTDNPFPVPADKQKNDTGAPDAPLDEKDKNRQPSEKPSSPETSPEQNPGQSSSSDRQPGTGNPPKLQQPDTVPSKGTSFPGGLLAILVFLAVLTVTVIFRIRTAPRYIAKGPESKETFNRLLDYSEKLSRYAGISPAGSYEERKKAFLKDPRFQGFDRLIDMLVKSKFSGVPLTVEERKEAASIIAEARKNCLAQMNLSEKIRFLLVHKL